MRTQLLILALFVTLAPAGAQDAARVVQVCSLEGTVDAGSAEYLRECVENATVQNARALLVVLDTPGGALESTREIVRAFLGAEVPVLVWIGPDGARAGSAGVFLTLASHVAGMSPGTNIGAAHPVVGPGGANPDAAGSEMARKIENDTVAFARAIAEQRGRNADWAEAAVKESASVSATEALKLDVIDVLASSREQFLDEVDGRTVKVGDRTETLQTAGARMEEIRPSLRQQVVHWLANPTLAYLLFLTGILGLAVELSHPGMVFPGVIGVISLLLALIAMSALPIQAGAVGLLIIGVGMLVAELFVSSGLLGLAGILLMGLAAVLLVNRFDPDWFVDPSFRIPVRLVIPSTVVLGGMAAFVVWRAAQGRRRPQLGGDAGMIGEPGRTLTEIGPEGGQVFVHGEIWTARADHPIPPNARVRVLSVDGLTLRVDEVHT